MPTIRSESLKKVVTIGGGTGSYMLLSGLKNYPLDITAVVSMFDSGGSSGVLRDEFGILPPGEVRRCLIALSDGPRAEILRDLFNFRFENGASGLHEHNFGNLFLLALSKIYGGDIQAIRKASELLDIKGKVLPVSLADSHVHAILEDGTEIIGETNIDIPKHNGELKIKKVFLEPAAEIFEETREAILAADLVVICPGDLYSSLMPGFLVEGMAEVLQESKGKKVVICNLMTKWGETNGFVASDMLKELLSYTKLPKFDYAVCNSEQMDEELVAAYAKEKKFPMYPDPGLEQCANKVILGEFFSNADIARHDPEKLAKVIAQL